MKHYLFMVCMVCLSSQLMANEKVAQKLEKYAWEKRQLIVFSPNEVHELYQLFKNTEKEYQADFKERNLHTWHIINNNKVTLGKIARNDINNESFRNAYNVDINEFQIILIGYDQGEKLRLSKVDINYIFSKIDSMPMRLQEMQHNSH